MTTTTCEKFSYFVFTDIINEDDYGDEQVSIYKNRFDDDRELTGTEVVEIINSSREEDLDICDGWSVVQWGGGDENEIGNYHIERKNYSTGEIDQQYVFIG